jgi:DNA-directed RNA polymerase specialized sigma24 family protein
MSCIPHNYDLAVVDPAEELSQRDLATLLDRAMAHLSPGTHTLLELCYLAEIPPREVALCMGLTIGALELRLYHVCQQRRQVLNGALRTDAPRFGLALDSIENQEWRETRQWYQLCGTH